MAEDIGIELHDKIKQAFDARCEKDSTLSHIKRKIENGTATMEDTSVYARRLGELLRKSIESTTKPDDLPGEKMYFNIAQSILEPLLRNNYDDVNTICEEVQSALDAKKGIGLKPQKADFPAERIRAAIGGAAVKETAEHAIQVLGRTAENITGSFQTDYIKKNAEFRSKAGLNCYIERKDGHNCCDWCSKLAGRYRYPDEVPKDVYRRHDNCTCDVSYVSEKGRQNVHSKRWANEQAKAQRIEYAAGLPKPMKLTKAEAKAKESEILAQRRLTYDGKRGIINAVNNTQDFMDREHRNTLSRKVSRNGKSVLEKWSVRSNPLGGYSNISSETFSRDAQAMAEYLDRTVNSGIYGTLDRIVIAKNSSLRGISTYDHVRNTLFISEELITKEGFERIVDTSYFPARNIDDVITHELDGHKRHWDMVKKFYNDNLDRYSSLEDAKQDYERSFRNYIVKQQSSDYFYVRRNISENAFIGLGKNGQINEAVADCDVLYRKGEILDNELKTLFKELMGYDG